MRELTTLVCCSSMEHSRYHYSTIFATLDCCSLWITERDAEWGGLQKEREGGREGERESGEKGSGLDREGGKKKERKGEVRVKRESE